jgi:hypothetical protein
LLIRSTVSNYEGQHSLFRGERGIGWFWKIFKNLAVEWHTFRTLWRRNEQIRVGWKILVKIAFFNLCAWLMHGETKEDVIDGRCYFAGLKVTKRNQATVLLTLTLFQTPPLTLILTPTLFLT